MRTGYLLAQQLKLLNTPNNNDRLARALWLANVVGYRIPLNPAIDFLTAFSETEKSFKDILNQVNENIAVDIKLAVSCYRITLRNRYALMNGTGDPLLVHAALNSHYAELGDNVEKRSMQDWLTSRSAFAASQEAAAAILEQHFADAD